MPDTLWFVQKSYSTNPERGSTYVPEQSLIRLPLSVMQLILTIVQDGGIKKSQLREARYHKSKSRPY